MDDRLEILTKRFNISVGINRKECATILLILIIELK
jgi:hypothetical protein